MWLQSGGDYNSIMPAGAYWIGRFLQLSGLLTTLYALPVGLFATESKRMEYELGLLALGVVLFGLGWIIQSRSRV